MLIYLCYKYSVPLIYEQFIDPRKAQCTERRAGRRPGLNSSPLGLRTNHWYSSFIHSFITTFKRSHCKLPAQCHDLSLHISIMYKMVLYSLPLKSICRFLPAVFKAALHIPSFSCTLHFSDPPPET